MVPTSSTTAPVLSDADLARYRERGFLLGPKVLGDDECDELCEELDRVIAQQGDASVPQPVRIADLGGGSGHPVWQIVNIWQASEAFRRLVFNARVVAAVAQLSGARELRIWHDQIQYKPPRDGGTNWWHQDAPYWGSFLDKDRQLTAWVALDDADLDNGCMSMVPGSHRWGNQIEFLHRMRQERGFRMAPRLGDHELEVVACRVPRGHVHFHHSLTWHGSHGNSSDRPRRAIALHYFDEQARFLEAGGHIMQQWISSRDGEPIRGEPFLRVL